MLTFYAVFDDDSFVSIFSTEEKAEKYRSDWLKSHKGLMVTSVVVDESSLKTRFEDTHPFYKLTVEEKKVPARFRDHKTKLCFCPWVQCASCGGVLHYHFYTIDEFLTSDERMALDSRYLERLLERFDGKEYSQYWCDSCGATATAEPTVGGRGIKVHV